MLWERNDAVIPTSEFRMLSVNAAEPADRTTAGTVVGEGDFIDLGEVDTTDEAQDTAVRVFWWRVTDMKGHTEVYNIRVWISSTEGLEGTDTVYIDVTDAWTPGKTAVQVKTGTPGEAPLAEPAPNITRIGGGPITGMSHDQTSQYIYLTGTIGVNETTGEKAGITLTVTFEYR